MTTNPLNELEVNSQLLHKALEMSQGDNRQITEMINHSLKTHINKTKLASLGYTEALFRLVKHNEIKKLFVKPVAKHEVKHDINAHLNDPNFCGVIYPSTIVEVFLTPKSNLLIQKSVDREIHYCNGTVIRENKAPRLMDFQVMSQADINRSVLPEFMHDSIMSLLSNSDMSRIQRELDEDFFEELEL